MVFLLAGAVVSGVCGVGVPFEENICWLEIDVDCNNKGIHVFFFFRFSTLVRSGR